MQITSLTWILTLVLIVSDILIHYLNKRPGRQTNPHLNSFEEHVHDDLAVLLNRN